MQPSAIAAAVRGRRPAPEDAAVRCRSRGGKPGGEGVADNGDSLRLVVSVVCYSLAKPGGEGVADNGDLLSAA